MFKINGIYRAQNSQRENGGRPFLHTYREYISPGGETCPDVIFDEYGYSQDLKDSGYYKIIEILNEDAVRDGLGAIDHYNAELRLEKTADENWLESGSAESFFVQLEGLGFYVAHKSISKYHDDKQEGWIGIDTERGVLAHCETNIDYLHVELTFLYPEMELVRELLDYEDSSHGGVTISPPITPKSLRDVPYSLPDTLQLTSFAPNIFDLIKKKSTSKGRWKKKSVQFHMPFVNVMEYEYPPIEFGVVHTEYDNRWYYSQGEYKVYFEKCRKIFQEFPSEVQAFLQEYTDVSARYLEGKPWKRFRNEQNMPVEHTDYMMCIKIVGIGKDGEEIAHAVQDVSRKYSDLYVQYVDLGKSLQKDIEDFNEDEDQDKRQRFSFPYCVGGRTMDGATAEVLKLLQGADFVIVLLPHPDDKSIKISRFVAGCANRIRALNLNLFGTQDTNASNDSMGDSLGVVYASLSDRAASLIKVPSSASTVGGQLLNVAKPLLSICSEGGWHSRSKELTPFAEMKEIFQRRREDGKMFYPSFGEAEGEHAARTAVNTVLSGIRQQGDIANADVALLDIEIGTKNTESLPAEIQNAIDQITSELADGVRILSHVSTDAALGEKVRLTLLARLDTDKALFIEQERVRQKKAAEDLKKWQESQHITFVPNEKKSDE